MVRKLTRLPKRSPRKAPPKPAARVRTKAQPVKAPPKEVEAKAQDSSPPILAPLSVVRFLAYLPPKGVFPQHSITYGGQSYKIGQGEHRLDDLADAWNVSIEEAEQIAQQGCVGIGCQLYNRRRASASR